MTLKRRLILQIVGMLAGVASLGIAGVVGMGTLHADLSIALRASDQLRQTYTVGAQVAAARVEIERDPRAAARAADEIERAGAAFDGFDATRWIDGTAPAAAEVGRSLHGAAAELRALPADGTAAFATPYARLADLIAATRRAVEQRQAIADAKRRWTLLALAGLSTLVVAAMIVVGVRQYRGVIGPLDGIRRSTRRFASGGFDARVPAGGDEEFAAVAADFNRMAADLQALYVDLESRVAIKSRELAQSERLASVGFLAAGVAHEINNPLGIIAGHGERLLMRLAHSPLPEASAAPVRDAVQVMCDEAFRCKRITDALLALAQPEADERASVRLDRLILDVVSSLSALPRFATREVTLDAHPDADWRLIANEHRLRQVILNLVLNALEATPTTGGRVRIALRRAGESIVEMRIADNGVGMTAATLGRAFEPFFTAKRGEAARERAGTGLGLSIAHSIVTHLGGRIAAHSDGAGLGSAFTVSLPGAGGVRVDAI